MVPSGAVARSLRNVAPSTFTREVILALTTSMPTTSSMSATHSVLPTLRSPFGALRPVAHLALIAFPSGDNRETYPLPSLSRIGPLIDDTKIDFDAAW